MRALESEVVNLRLQNRDLREDNESLKKRLTRLQGALEERRKELVAKEDVVSEVLESMIKLGEKMHNDRLKRKEVAAKLDYLVEQVGEFVLSDQQPRLKRIISGKELVAR